MMAISGGGGECQHVELRQHQDLRLSSSSLGSLFCDAKLSSSAKTKAHNHQNRRGKEGIKGLEQAQEELVGY